MNCLDCPNASIYKAATVYMVNKYGTTELYHVHCKKILVRGSRKHMGLYIKGKNEAEFEQALCDRIPCPKK